MRARRPLRPDNFPFLAVLLCTMGSLILLLLVIDRRAKIVAKFKARQVAVLRERDDAEAARRAAELEERRRALRSRLLAEEADLRGQLAAAQTELTAAQGRTTTEAAATDEARRRLAASREQLRLAGETLAAEQNRAAETRRKGEATAEQLASLTADLQRLEQTLADVKAARRLAQQTYSLVPYHGKRGTTRQPLYVECDGQGFVFHPDRKTLRQTDLDPASLRREVEGRVARQRAEVVRTGAQPEAKAYLLVLVRPEGIANYYTLLGAMRGADLDFGYEFIERDWALDFSESDPEIAARPWTQVRPPVVAGVPGPARPGLSPEGYRFGDGSPGVPAMAGVPGVAGGRPGMSPSPGIAIPGDQPGLRGPAPSAPSPSDTAPSSLPGGVAAAMPGGSAPRPPGQEGNDSPTEGAARPDPSGLPKLSAPPMLGTPQPRGGEVAGPPPQLVTDTPMPTGPTGPTSATGTPRLPSGDDGSRDPLQRLAPRTVGERERPPSPPPLPRLTGNRDWTILIGCSADAVELPAANLRLSAREFAPGGTGTAALQQAVSALIARKQTLVRPGEPPFRPMLRFVVRRDGLRTYYAAFPALESLRLPMSRENPSPEDDP